MQISPVVAGGGSGSGGSGTVTQVSVVSANGLAGTVANATSAPAITLSTTITGILSGNGTAISAAATTGSGSVVLATSPTLVTPVLGVASATSINKVAITAPATGSTLTIADGKTLTASNTLTFTGTDASSVAFGSGGTVAYTANNLSVFAATTSAQLAGVISDETGSGSLVFATSPSLTTPTLGVASATSINFGGGALSTFVPWTNFTPTVTLVGGAGNTTPQYSTNAGRYMQIGNVVFFDVDLSGDGGNEGAGTGQINIALPVAASANQLTDYYPVGNAINGSTYTPTMLGQIAPSATTIVLGKVSAGSFTSLQGADQNNTTRTIRIHSSYEV